MFYYNFHTVLIVRVGMLNSIIFISSLNTTIYLGASGQKSDLAIRFGDPDFVWQHNNSSVGIHFHHVLEILSSAHAHK